MIMLRLLAQFVVLFLSLGGFLFGQLFAGVFSVGGTLAGLGGAFAAALAFAPAEPRIRRLVLRGCAVGIAGAGLHVAEYYALAAMPGNYYAWFLTLPFMGALGVIAWAVYRARPLPDALGGAVGTG